MCPFGCPSLVQLVAHQFPHFWVGNWMEVAPCKMCVPTSSPLVAYLVVHLFRTSWVYILSLYYCWCWPMRFNAARYAAVLLLTLSTSSLLDDEAGCCTGLTLLLLLHDESLSWSAAWLLGVATGDPAMVCRPWNLLQVTKWQVLELVELNKNYQTKSMTEVFLPTTCLTNFLRVKVLKWSARCHGLLYMKWHQTDEKN